MNNKQLQSIMIVGLTYSTLANSLIILTMIFGSLGTLNALLVNMLSIIFAPMVAFGIGVYLFRKEK